MTRARIVAIVAALALLPGCATMQDITHGKFGSGASSSATNPVRSDADRRLAAYDYGRAEAGYRSVLEKNPGDDAARLGLAESQLGLRKFNEARTTFLSLASVKGYEARAKQGIGLVELRGGNLDAAIPSLNAAANRDGTLWRTWNALGQAYDLSKNWRISADAYSHALKYAPDTTLVRNNIGVSLLAQGRYDEALKEFDAVLKSNPNLATARTNRQITLAMMQRYPDALMGMPPDEKARALNNIGYVAMLKGDYDNAEKFFNQSMQENPGNTTAQENLDLMQRLKQDNAKNPAAPPAATN